VVSVLDRQDTKSNTRVRLVERPQQAHKAAVDLNGRASATGGSWYAATVIRLRERLGLWKWAEAGVGDVVGSFGATTRRRRHCTPPKDAGYPST